MCGLDMTNIICSVYGVLEIRLWTENLKREIQKETHIQHIILPTYNCSNNYILKNTKKIKTRKGMDLTIPSFLNICGKNSQAGARDRTITPDYHQNRLS